MRTVRPLMLMLTATLLLAHPARADDVKVPPGWQRAPQSSFPVPAGALCSFGVQADVLKDEVITKVLSTFPDGSMQSQIWVGDLVYRFTNTSTGKSVVRDIGGDGLERVFTDGSVTWSYLGPVLIGFPAGAPVAEGLWVVNGVHVYHYGTDGSIEVLASDGKMENLCVTLQ